MFTVNRTLAGCLLEIGEEGNVGETRQLADSGEDSAIQR